jgi:ABC-type multidrug transport system ATPase subunit
VGILNGGRLLDVGPVPRLLASGVREWEIAADALPERLVKELAAAGHSVESVGSRTIVRIEDPQALQEALRDLFTARVFIHAVEPRRRTLEEHFVEVLGRDGEVRR